MFNSFGFSTMCWLLSIAGEFRYLVKVLVVLDSYVGSSIAGEFRYYTLLNSSDFSTMCWLLYCRFNSSGLSTM